MKTEFETPIAFFIFNRPETTALVFNEIRKIRPKKLLIVADGPRLNVLGEDLRCSKTREVVDAVDWNCEVLSNYSDVNMGCKARMSTGIDWVFSEVSEAIFLEDDCLPALSFFRFCEEMLSKYRLDQRVGMISGDNFNMGVKVSNASYYFSKNTHIWGWASWADRWVSKYDVEMKSWQAIKEQGLFESLTGGLSSLSPLKEAFDLTHSGLLNTWDYQYAFLNLIEGRLNVIPEVNLVKNIGFGSDATHTKKITNEANLDSYEMEFPVTHPVGMFQILGSNDIDGANRGLFFKVARSLKKYLYFVKNLF